MAPEDDHGNGYDGKGYMDRVSDLENPLPLDSPIFLPPRPDNIPPPEAEHGSKKQSKSIIILSEEDKEKQRKEYYESVKLPASSTFDKFPSDCITEVLPGKAWVVPNLLSEEECEDIIKEGEAFGIEGEVFKSERRARTSKRTTNWKNQELSIKISKSLSEEILNLLEASAPYTSVRGIHPNWRVARYKEGETFPAHNDQADSVVVEHPEKMKQRFTSSHTLLIYLRRRGEQFQGGATRLFVDGTYTGTTIDVCLPQGYGLFFQQKGLLHAGLPVEGTGAKYIAQAGLLRAEPNHSTGPCAIFKYGPGLAPY